MAAVHSVVCYFGFPGMGRGIFGAGANPFGLIGANEVGNTRLRPAAQMAMSTIAAAAAAIKTALLGLALFAIETSNPGTGSKLVDGVDELSDPRFGERVFAHHQQRRRINVQRDQRHIAA